MGGNDDSFVQKSITQYDFAKIATTVKVTKSKTIEHTGIGKLINWYNTYVYRGRMLKKNNLVISIN